VKYFELITIGAAFFNLVLTLFVFSRDWRSTINRVYLLWGLPITIWNLGTFFMFRVNNPEEALFWARFLQFGVIFLPISLLHLGLLVAQVPTGKWIRWLYAVQVVFLISNCTDLFISDVRPTPFAYYSVAGPAFWPFMLVYCASSCTILLVLYRRQKLASYQHRTRSRYMMVAAGILIVFGMNDIAPIFGVDVYPLTHIRIYPLGSLAAIFYSLIVSYSVLQHHLLDIHIKLGRIAAHFVRILFLFMVSFCLLLILALLQPAEFTPFAFISALAVLLVGASVATIFFPRLFGQGDDAIERRILGDRFEYHDKIQSFIQSIPWYSDTNLLLKDFHELLVKTIRVQSYQIMLLDEARHAVSVVRSHPEQPLLQPPDLRRGSPVFQYFRDHQAEYLAFNLKYEITGETPLEAAARTQLKAFELEFCFPFLSDNEPFGLLLVGGKTSGEPYTRHDLHLLNSLVKNLSLVINQIRLKNQILLAEELELLGRMSRGMAHDLNNLLTPVSTFLQLYQGGGLPDDTADDLLPTSMRNVKTIQAYIKESLFFAQNHQLHILPGRLDLLLHQVAELAAAKLKRKQVGVDIHVPGEVNAEMDKVLVQRLLGNLLSNAIDASPPGSRVRLELERLATTDTQRGDWLRVRVVDQGGGMNRENLDRISSAYFTTKDSGDEDRGFGLGLAICRKIVHLHGGNLVIASEEKKGTTVQVDLPSRQIDQPKIDAMKVS
jgi:signal transduction histidine kinase